MHPHEFRRLRAPDAAEYVGLAASTLAKMRLRGSGPTFLKAGPRVVVYDTRDLDAWLASRRRRSTSDRGADEAAWRCATKWRRPAGDENAAPRATGRRNLSKTQHPKHIAEPEPSRKQALPAQARGTKHNSPRASCERAHLPIFGVSLPRTKRGGDDPLPTK